MTSEGNDVIRSNTCLVVAWGKSGQLRPVSAAVLVEVWWQDGLEISPAAPALRVGLAGIY